MNRFQLASGLLAIGLGLAGCFSQKNQEQRSQQLHWFEAHASEHSIIMALGDSSLGAMTHRLSEEGEVVHMITNGGMFHPDLQPVGLYIEEGIEHTPLSLDDGSGNFYWKPNGIFMVDASGEPSIVVADDWLNRKPTATYATQSGPMLVIDGNLHAGVQKSTASEYIRNGVGILPSGHALFGISKSPMNFLDFALAFQQAGCPNALYLDGAISRMHTDTASPPSPSGQFGVMIAAINL